MLLSYKWDWVWDGKSLCGATLRASLCDANNVGWTMSRSLLSCFKVSTSGITQPGGFQKVESGGADENEFQKDE